MPRTTRRRPQGRALTIGLDSLGGGGIYAGFRPLTVAEADAKDIADIAKSRGFAATTLLGRSATQAAVKAEITAAAEALSAGDVFLLSFSGHGDRVPDRNGEEADFRDEVWCLYDRRLIDDDLFRLWAEFKRSVRIFVLADSCHSGTSIIPHFRRRERTARSTRVEASVLLISACQDNELAYEDSSNSIFIKALKRVWKNGRFRGNYRSFCERISTEQGPGGGRQTPNYLTTGRKNRAFERQKPFTI